MGILGRLFGNTPDRQRDAKFQEFERSGGDPEGDEFVRFQKAAWLISRGNAMGSAGRFEDAIRDFTEAIEHDPSHVGSYLGLALCYREQRRLPEALGALERAPRTMKLGTDGPAFSTDLDVYPVKATIYMLMGDREKTVECAKRAIAAGSDPMRRGMHERAVSAGVIQAGPGDEEMVQLMHEMVKDFS